MSTPTGAASKNIRFLSRNDQGGRPDGVQVIVQKGHAFIGHMFSDGFSVVDVRDRAEAEDGCLRRRAEKYALAPPASPRRHPACGERPQCLGDAAISEPAGLLRQVAGRLDDHGAAFRRRPARVRHLQARGPARDRLSRHAGLRRAPHLVGRRALRLRLGAFRRLYRSRAGGHRRERSGQAIARRPLVAARHAPRRRRDAASLVRQAHRAASPDRRRQSRLRRLARRRLDRARPFRSGASQAHRAPQYGPALCRRRAHAAAAARPQSLVLADEATSVNCANGLAYTWIYRRARAGQSRHRSPRCRRPPARISAPRAASSARTICTRTGRARCRRSDIVFATYHNAGLRVFDITNQFAPKEVGYYRTAAARDASSTSGRTRPRSSSPATCLSTRTA